MKKIIILLVLVCSISMPVQSQVDTLSLERGDRDLRYYWWDSNWADIYWNAPGVWSGSFPWCRGFQGIVARHCYVEKELSVYGLAGIMFVEYRYSYLDSTRLPEYLILYEATDSSFVALDSVCITDTMPPRHKYRVQYTAAQHAFDEYYNIYEGYFARSYTVRDSFYVGGTCYNTLFHDSLGVRVYPYTMYLALYNEIGRLDTVSPDPHHKPEYIKERSTFLQPTSPLDSSWLDWQWYDFGGSYLCLFPIYDTTGMGLWQPDTLVVDDSCYGVEGFRVLGIEENRATLTWEVAHGQTSWEIAYGHTGTPPEECRLHRTTGCYPTLQHLDTSQWYVAYIRADCDTLGYSAWSDSIRFYVSPVGGISFVTIVDESTQIFPNPAQRRLNVLSSFWMRRIEIYNLQGELLLQQTAYGIHAVLDISSLPSGHYFVGVHTNAGVSTKKLVVQR